MRRNAEFMSPTGKVPFLRCGAFLLGDFDSIIQHVTERGITTGLTKAEQAEMRTYMCTVNNVFHNAEVCIHMLRKYLLLKTIIN